MKTTSGRRMTQQWPDPRTNRCYLVPFPSFPSSHPTTIFQNCGHGIKNRHHENSSFRVTELQVSYRPPPCNTATSGNRCQPPHLSSASRTSSWGIPCPTTSPGCLRSWEMILILLLNRYHATRPSSLCQHTATTPPSYPIIPLPHRHIARSSRG